MKKRFSLCIYVLLLSTVFVSVRLAAQQPNEKTDNGSNKPLIDKRTAVPHLVWDKETWKRTRVPSAREKIEKTLSVPLAFELTKTSTYSELFKILKERTHIMVFWDNRYINSHDNIVKTTINSVVANVEPAQYDTIPLGRALELILCANHLAYIVDEGFLLITSEERAEEIKEQQAEQTTTVTKPSIKEQIRAELEAVLAHIKPAVPPAFAPDYRNVLELRFRHAKEKYDNCVLLKKENKITLAEVHQAELGLAEAEYVLKHAQKAGQFLSAVSPKESMPDVPPPSSNYTELLNQRLALAKEKLALVKAKHDAAAQGGEVWFYCDAQIAVADAEIALYRNTGEEKKWQVSLEQKLQWTQEKREAFEASVAVAGIITPEQLLDAKQAVLEAEYELKRKSSENSTAVTP